MKVQITECPRDAMQGITEFIPTETKVNYLNGLLNCGFDTLDFGSFVSPKAIPQLADTAAVVEQLIVNKTKLLAIVANERGAEQAGDFEQITYLGYPFSISETFQKRNTNATIEESLHRVESIATICAKQNKQLVLYLSMGFGNPYGDSWSPDMLAEWTLRLTNLFPVHRISLSDTIGAATPSLVESVFKTIVPAFPSIEVSAHLHTIPDHAQELTAAAYNGGCTFFEGAIKGFGGCPMAADKLTGNMPTEKMIDWFQDQSIETGLEKSAFSHSLVTAEQLFHY